MWVEPEDQQNNINGQPTNGTNLSVGTGGGTASAGQTSKGTTSNPSTLTPVQSNQPKQDFATVQDYLKSNQPQGEALGQQFSSKLGESTTNEKNAIDTAAGQTTNDINAGSTSYDPNLVSKTVADPTSVAGNPDQLSAFLKQWNASYSGPSSFETSTSYTPAAAAANEATQKAGEVGTVGGRQQLLQDEFNVYGQGNKGLDQALIQTSGAFPTIQTQGKELASIPDYLTSKAANVNTQATAAQAAADAAKINTQNAFNGSLSGFQSDLAARTKAAQDAAAVQANNYTAALKSGDAGKISAALQNSNLTDAQKSNLTDYLTAINKNYGANPDLSNTYNFNPNTDVNTANTATAADYAKAAALGKLTGVDYSGALNPADVAKAGTAANPNTGLDANTIDQNLRQYLVQQEIASLQPKPTNGGSSSQDKGNNNLAKNTAIGVGLLASPLGAGLTGGLLAGGAKLGNKIADSLGFGGGKKDAVVNLPGMNLPSMPIPKTANAATTKAIVDVYNKPLNTQGSYHEGAIYDVVNRLGVLKDAASKGQISPDEYTAYAKPLAQWAQQATNTIMSASSEAANSVKSGYYNLINNYSDLLK